MMRLVILAFLFSMVFLWQYSFAERSSFLLVYREDIPFYFGLAQRLFKKSSAEEKVFLCPLKDWPKCMNGKYSHILVFGDLAYKKLLDSSLDRKAKIFAFFVTDCSKNKGRNICCCHLFPTLQETVRVLQKEFKNQKFLVLYTSKTKWWVRGYTSPKVLFFQLDIDDLRESLRKAFKNDPEIFILAPDFLFMHPSFLKDVVQYSFLFSKILVGLSLKMQKYGVPVVVFYDYHHFWQNFTFDLLRSQGVKIPLRLSLASWHIKP